MNPNRARGLTCVVVRTALLAGASGAIGLGGCEPRSRPTHGGAIVPSGQTGDAGNAVVQVPEGKRLVPAWPFWPDRMRIHPLTRMVSEAKTGRPLLEARVEFLDPWGATTKASGQLTLRLFADATVPDAGEPLETWNINLRDLETNAQQYDDVTRTYLMRLQFDPAKLTPEPDLRAYFVATNGSLLHHAMRLSK